MLKIVGNIGGRYRALLSREDVYATLINIQGELGFYSWPSIFSDKDYDFSFSVDEDPTPYVDRINKEPGYVAKVLDKQQ